MEGYCENYHPLWRQQDGNGIGCLSWECPEHIRHSWEGQRPLPPKMYSSRVKPLVEKMTEKFTPITGGDLVHCHFCSRQLRARNTARRYTSEFVCVPCADAREKAGYPVERKFPRRTE